MSGQWIINGCPGDLLPVTDRGLNYADGLFETIAIRAGSPRLLDYHLERLENGCSRLLIPFACAETLESEISGLVGDCDYGIVKIIITRGSGPRGYARPADPRPTRIVGLYQADPPLEKMASTRASVRLCQMRVGRNEALGGLKTLGRLEQVLARAEWTEADIHEGLLRADTGHLVGGTHSNLFLVTENGLLTPDLTAYGVKGIMRRLVMEQAKILGIACRETDITIDDLYHANEVFLTNSQFVIRPVGQIEAHHYSTWQVTQRLIAHLAELGISER
jgi:4-amino-4-deoxychorismate lyase